MKTILDIEIKPIHDPESGGVLEWVGYCYKGGKEL
jgi:hypothetical protein